MDTIIHNIFRAQDECTLILAELLKVLAQERLSLIRLEINEISESTRLKEILGAQLRQKITRLNRLIEGNFNSAVHLEGTMTEMEEARWKSSRHEFWKNYEELKGLCEMNQQFLKSSLRNLSTLSDQDRKSTRLNSSH